MINTCFVSKDFEYFEPKTAHEALSLLKKYGEKAKVMAGGTDLIVRMKLGQWVPNYIINIERIPEWKYINEEGLVKIGCATRICELENSKVIQNRYTALQEAAKLFSSTQIKNMATIGGNLCNASPAGDTACALLVFESSVKLVGDNGERIIALEEFFLEPGKTVLSPDEILTEILMAETGRQTASTFLKIGRVKADMAKISVAIRVERDNEIVKSLRIALGSVAKTPMRLKNIEKKVEGESFVNGLIEEISRLVSKEIRPITDVRSTAEYRREVSKYLVGEALSMAWESAGKVL